MAISENNFGASLKCTPG
ncbi:hypothetical protein CP8484711_1933A, partial [Chlamydia psittaci 84-8471/1]